MGENALKINIIRSAKISFEFIDSGINKHVYCSA